MNGRVLIQLQITFLMLFISIPSVYAKREISILQFTSTLPELKVEAALPTAFEVDAKADKNDENQDIDVYYIVGGVRLGLLYQQDTLTELERELNPTMKWQFSVPGRICQDQRTNSQCADLAADTEHAIDLSPTPDDETFQVYWEPESWIINLKADVTVTYDFRGQKVSTQINGVTYEQAFPNKTEQFRIESRSIGPAGNGEEPLEGSDVKMLEQMLWQLGVSPGASPGIEGRRIADEAQRQIFNTGNNTVGKMLGRFNYFSHTPINRTTDQQGMINVTYNGVNYNTIDELRKHWLHFKQAHESFSGNQRYLYSNLSQEDKNAAEAVFDGTITYPRGVTLANVDATYTAALHGNVSRYRAFNRVDILRAMAQQESNGRHWGYSTRANDHYRITVGGADEAGSAGFNQIQNKYAYGGLSLDGTFSPDHQRNNACVPVSAYTQAGASQVNHYDPGQNLVAKAVWLVGQQGNCGRSFRRAFNDNAYTGTYRSAANRPLRSFTTGTTVAAETVTGGNHTDDTYELLVKAIGAYNQGAGVFNRSAWVSLLTSQMTLNSREFNRIREIPYKRRSNDEKLAYGRTVAMEYGMSVMHDDDKLNLPYRKYRWQGGTYPAQNPDGTPHPRAGQAWCFEFGEEDWLTPAFDVNIRTGGTRPANWNDYAMRATRNDIYKLECS